MCSQAGSPAWPGRLLGSAEMGEEFRLLFLSVVDQRTRCKREGGTEGERGVGVWGRNMPMCQDVAE